MQNSIHTHQTSSINLTHPITMHNSRITSPIPLSPHLRLKPNHPHKNLAVSAQLVRNNSSIQASLRVVSAQLRTTKTDYSISDADLESRGFHLRRTPDGLNLTHLNSVFVSVGFPKRDPDKIRTALDHTDSLLWVEYEKTKRPVAFARATGDGVFNAIIWDVVVDPSFQGIGLGKAVMERVVSELLGKGIRNIALYSEPRVLGFYRPLGFVADPDGITGMVYSREQKKKK